MASQQRMNDHEVVSKNSSDTMMSTTMDHEKQPAEKFESDHVVDAPKQKELESDEPPDGGYGWVVVLGAFLINFHSWGINSAYGVFLAYYLSNNTYPGASYLDFAFVGGLSIGAALLIAPIATNSVRKFGTKPTLSIGIALETTALITAGSTTEIWQLFLSQGVCFGFGMGFLFVASVGLAPQWFLKRRSLANGICAAGSGIGALTYNLAANAIIERISLAWAFRILGICAFAANTFAMIIVKDRNKQVGSRTVGLDWRLFKRWEFNLVQGWGFFSMLGYVVVLFSLPNYAKTVLGLTASQGSTIAAILNLGQGIGRPPVGYFSDTLGRINMAMSMTFLSGIFALAIWIPSDSYGVLLFYALIGGAVLGTYWATVAPVEAEVIGLQDLPSGLSITWLFLVLPTTFSEPIALELVENTSSGYLSAQLFAGLMYIAAGLCLVPLRAWKIRDLERIEIEKSRETLTDSRTRTPWLKAIFLLRKV